MKQHRVPRDREKGGGPFIGLSPPHIKTVSYLVSTISVVLLAIVAWPKAKESPLLLACLIGGALTSVIGMFCRWLSYEIEKRRNE